MLQRNKHLFPSLYYNFIYIVNFSNGIDTVLKEIDTDVEISDTKRFRPKRRYKKRKMQSVQKPDESTEEETPTRPKIKYKRHRIKNIDEAQENEENVKYIHVRIKY